VRISPPDFHRDVHCIFGLPFDAIGETECVRRVRAAAGKRERLFLSTPNLSFASGCRDDVAFRQSVVDSDLCTADGKPIVWLARLMGAPLHERVAGSTVFDRLTDEPGDKISVYFFGGPPGSAEQAASRINHPGRLGARVVGHATPGFGTLEEMSGPQWTQPINAAGPDFLVVALGARKGQAWIERNWRSLEVPVVSHLGAVVNFVAGSVARAPVWMQQAGLEWAWRIKEEPSLWRRYWQDAKALARHLLFGVIPWLVVHGRSVDAQPRMGLARSQRGDHVVLTLTGRADNGPSLEPLRDELTAACASGATVTLDVAGLTYAGTGFMALVQLLDGWQRNRTGQPVLSGVKPRLARGLRWTGAGYLLESSQARVADLGGVAGTAQAPLI
jgi:N-acetylglucosaminyldiphosphoundecaprenol N-acetyl-beta-D-mannosaminyltransferase